MTNIQIPFLDLEGQWEPLILSIQADIQKIINSRSFVGGTYIDTLEEKLSSYTGVKHAIGTSSGTSAIEVLLKAWGIGPGDEVLVPTNSFIATAFAVSNVGATPVFLDCDDTYLVSLYGAENLITPRTKAIIVVHLYGQQVNMAAVNEFANNHNLLIFEDAAQGIGLPNLGSLSNGATLSFYPGKNLGAFGDGGAVLVNDFNIAKTIKQIINQGQESKYNHVVIGGNYRLDTIQTIPLIHGLDHINRWNLARSKIAAIYSKNLPSYICPLITSSHVFHLYEICLSSKEEKTRIQEYLTTKGISTGLHYPTPIHKTKAYSHYNNILLPNSEKFAKRLLSLPIFPTMRYEQVKYVISSLIEVL